MFKHNKTKNVSKGENEMACENRSKIICIVRQVMQSANCAPARRLKNELVDLTRDDVVHQVKPVVNEK